MLVLSRIRTTGEVKSNTIEHFMLSKTCHRVVTYLTFWMMCLQGPYYELNPIYWFLSSYIICRCYFHWTLDKSKLYTCDQTLGGRLGFSNIFSSFLPSISLIYISAMTFIVFGLCWISQSTFVMSYHLLSLVYFLKTFHSLQKHCLAFLKKNSRKTLNKLVMTVMHMFMLHKFWFLILTLHLSECRHISAKKLPSCPILDIFHKKNK